WVLELVVSRFMTSSEGLDERGGLQRRCQVPSAGVPGAWRDGGPPRIAPEVTRPVPPVAPDATCPPRWVPRDAPTTPRGGWNDTSGSGRRLGPEPACNRGRRAERCSR